MSFSLRQLGYFKALTEHRNFGRAAQACHISQPALSVQIRALETAMGAALVERRARDVVLTPLGRQVLGLAADVLAAADRLERVARDRNSGRRSLNLGLIPTLAPYLLPGVLGALRGGDLSLSIQVREARTKPLLEALRAGELDAAVLALPSGGEAVSELALFRDRFLLAGSKARLDRLGAGSVAIRPTDLESSQLMLLEDGHCLSDQALDACGKDRSGSGINMGASSLGTLSRLVAAGFGLTLMPELATRAEMAAAPGMALCRFPDPQPARMIGLVRRAGAPDEPWFEDLAELIRTVGSEIVSASRADYGPDVSRPADISG
jgi:LysR family transcriptional regulator, hydrogen peroxide-inducible genes activator